MAWALKTDGLTKIFRGNPAVDRVSLRVPEGTVYGFLGPNGAGKTTTLRLVLGLIRPNAGTIDVLGRRVGQDSMPRVGALIETPSLYPHLTGYENLDITRRLLSLPATEIGRVLEIVESELPLFRDITIPPPVNAYLAGRQAGREGAPADSNPHTPGSEEFVRWGEGHQCGVDAAAEGFRTGQPVA